MQLNIEKIRPLVSVIVPVYKAESFIGLCVDSIVKQTYKNLEIILIDDGSPDKSGELCDRISLCDERITVIHKKNEGVTLARIDGLRASNGDYVFFLDSDDTIEKNAVEILISLSLTHRTDIVVCQMYLCYKGEKNLQYRPIRSGYYSKDDINNLLKTNFLYDIRYLRSGYPLYLCGKLYRRETIIGQLEKGIGYKYGEDMVSTFSIVKKVNSLYVTNDILYNYVQNENQATRQPLNIMLSLYEKVWMYSYYFDIEHYWDIQLPNRIWNIMQMSLLQTSHTYGFSEYKKICKQINNLEIMRMDEIMQRSRIIGSINKIQFSLLVNKCFYALYLLQKHNILYKIISKLKK